MLSFASIALAAASAAASPAPMSTTSWWERITVTYDGAGLERSCDYETSFSRSGPQRCEVETAPASMRKCPGGVAGVQTKITFERRFTPGAPRDLDSLKPGDTFLGGHVMMVAIGRDGSVSGCSIVAASGEARPAYGCEQVRAERFQASAGGAARESQVGFLTVFVYGHEEEIV